MQAALKNIAAHFQEGIGIPATLAQVLEDKPALLMKPEQRPASIDTREVVRWDRFGQSFNGRIGTVRGWVNEGGYYHGFDLKRSELTEFGQEEVIENWQCDIQQVAGLSASKSDLSAFTSLDAMAEARAKHLVTPLTEEALRNNLQHGEIRILQPASSDYFEQHQWDGRTFLANAGGSHHFAAARYLAGRLNVEVPLTGRLVRHSINPAALALLRRDFDIFLISDEPCAYCAFHDAMHRFLATYFWMPVPQGFCDQARAVLLPVSQIRSVRVSNLLRKAGAFDLGAYLSGLVEKQQ